MSRIRGKIQGVYYVDFEGIKYPVSKDLLIQGSGVDERVKGGKQTEYVYDHLRQFFRPGDTVLDRLPVRRAARRRRRLGAAVVRQPARTKAG